ncbi:MAG: hypothetical protein FGM33_05660 [Candidatus Kapabacteria bacterium]|nr:hypothetical protein [Candidatus Kapabacteria bacterium]
MKSIAISAKHVGVTKSPRILDAEITGQELQDIQSLLGKHGVQAADFGAAVLFLRSVASTDRPLTLDDVVGIATYKYERDGNAFNMFIRRSKSSNFALFEDLSCTAGSVSANTIGFIASRTLQDLGYDVETILVIASDAYQPLKDVGHGGGNTELNAKIWLASSSHYRSQFRSFEQVMGVAPGSGGKGCENACPSMGGDECTWINPKDGWHCQHRVKCCAIVSYRTDGDILIAVGQDTIESALDTVLLRAFRDQTLIETSWGTKLISYYNYCSQIIDTSDVPLILKARAVALLFKFNLSTLNVLMDESLPSESVLIPQSLRSELIDLLTAYQSVSSDPVYRQVINDLISDVESFGSMTVAGFRNAAQFY